MFKKYSQLKIALPASFLPYSNYYHGSQKEKAVIPIFTEGLKGAEIQKKHFLAPVKSGVYLTPDFKYAMIYALGGDIIGSKGGGRADAKINKYGFMYVVSKEDMGTVHPDEDFIGELIWDTLRTSNDEFEWLVNIAKKVATPYQFRKLKEGEYLYFAAVGKKVLKVLHDENEKKLLMHSNLNAHIFNLGITKVKGCFVLRRDRPDVLTGDLQRDRKYMSYISTPEELPLAKENLRKVFGE